MASMEGPLGRLTSALHALTAHWGSASAVWTDQVQRQIQSDYGDPLAKETEATAKVIAELGSVIESARKAVK